MENVLYVVSNVQALLFISPQDQGFLVSFFYHIDIIRVFHFFLLGKTAFPLVIFSKFVMRSKSKEK